MNTKNNAAGVPEGFEDVSDGYVSGIATTNEAGAYVKLYYNSMGQADRAFSALLRLADPETHVAPASAKPAGEVLADERAEREAFQAWFDRWADRNVGKVEYLTKRHAAIEAWKARSALATRSGAEVPDDDVALTLAGRCKERALKAEAAISQHSTKEVPSRDDVLEEAARVCDDKYAARATQGFPREASTARALAVEIRALKGIASSEAREEKGGA